MSALTDAIARSFTTGEPERPALSSMRALGRRQLSGVEVLAQSVATTAPAVSMVILPLTMLTHDRLVSGIVTILVATIAVTLIAFCVSQFTRRMAAAGGLHSFAFRGSGSRAALTAAVAMLVKYVGSAVMTLYHGGQAVIALCGLAGFSPPAPPVYLALAVGILCCLVRGVRFAAVTILAVEMCSLAFIVALMLFGDNASAPVLVPPASGHGTLALVLTALFALAGFESAAFFGPEARRPLVTVTRTVLLTPLICGSLFLFAGWAAWTGRSDTLVDAYLHGTATGVDPVIVVALNADHVLGQDGHPDGTFAGFVERYGLELRRYCRPLAPRRRREDIVQETFIAAWNQLSSFRGDASIRTWLFAICTRKVLDCTAGVDRRRRRRRCKRGPCGCRSRTARSGSTRRRGTRTADSRRR
ncbi:hypothetical protein GS463_07710 [Rhodococcus hoagii]|nr:hypothetical protein [Prescottella equi]